jgi:glycosyltransferase involved in cell wall biosynthesis
VPNSPAKSPPQKIIHVMRRFVPAKWGGTESVVYHLAREFTRLGVESPIYATAMFAKAGSETFGGVQIHRFPYSLPWWGLSKTARHALELKGGNPLSFSMLRALRREKAPGLLHAHVQHRLGGIVRTSARHHGIPYVVSIHGGHHTLPAAQTAQMLAPTRGCPEWGKLAGWWLGARRTLDDAAAIYCVGEDETAAMRRARPAQAVHYQPNGVDVERFATARAESFYEKFPHLQNRRMILCVSRVDGQKNQLLLMEAFARVQRELPDHHVVFIGANVVPDYAAALEKAMQSEALRGHVTWIPGLAPDDPALPGAFRAAEMFVLPSRHEPFGIVILEAWAAGLPVLATHVGGIPGFVTSGQDALLFPSEDVEACAQGLRRLATEPACRETLARRGAEKVRREFDWPVVARRLLDSYPSTSSASSHTHG